MNTQQINFACRQLKIMNVLKFEINFHTPDKKKHTEAYRKHNAGHS